MSNGRCVIACTDDFAVLVDGATGRSWSCDLNPKTPAARVWRPIPFAGGGPGAQTDAAAEARSDRSRDPRGAARQAAPKRARR